MSLSSFVYANCCPHNKWFSVTVCSLSLSNKVANGFEFKIYSISENSVYISVKFKQLQPVLFFMYLFTDPTNLSQKPPKHGASSDLKIHFMLLCTSNNCALFEAKIYPLSVKMCFGQPLPEIYRVKLSNKVSE